MSTIEVGDLLYEYTVKSPTSIVLITVRIFEESGHTPQFEESERFDRELLGWMQQHS